MPVKWQPPGLPHFDHVGIQQHSHEGSILELQPTVMVKPTRQPQNRLESPNARMARGEKFNHGGLQGAAGHGIPTGYGKWVKIKLPTMSCLHPSNSVPILLTLSKSWSTKGP